MASGGTITTFFEGDLSGLNAAISRAGAMGAAAGARIGSNLGTSLKRGSRSAVRGLDLVVVSTQVLAAQGSDNLTKFGKAGERAAESIRRSGMFMTQGLTLPLLAIGGVSAKLATTFDREMTKIETLVGVARDDVDRWRASLRAMSTDVAVGPAELARALFVVTSAGERTDEALRIVENAAKASAIGLGDTATSARAITAAMTAYGKENLTAARATEVLLGTIREGNLEAASLAGVLGRVIPIAAQMGVEFGEVGGFIASFTRLGVNAREAVTALRGALNAALKPASDSAKALEEVGSSSAELRRQIREKGLAIALIDLVKLFEGNDEALARVIPNVRALAGVLGVTGAQAEQFARISASLTGDLDELQKGFNRAKETPAFQFRQMKVELANAAIEIGNRLLPALVDLANSMGPVIKGVTAMAKGFESLPDIFKTATGAMLGFLVVLGPLAIGIGTLVGVLSSVAKALAPVLGAIAAASPVFLGIVAALAVAGVAILAFGNDVKRVQQVAKDFSGEWSDAAAILNKTELTRELSEARQVARGLREEIGALFAGGTTRGNPELLQLEADLRKANAKAIDLKVALDNAITAGVPEDRAELVAGIAEAKDRVNDLEGAIADMEARSNAVAFTGLVANMRAGLGEARNEVALLQTALNELDSKVEPTVDDPVATEKQLTKRFALEARHAQLLVDLGQSTVEEQRAQLAGRLQQTEAAIGTETELYLSLMEDLVSIDKELVDSTADRIRQERRLEEDRANFLVQIGQMTAQARIAEIDQQLDAVRKGSADELRLQQERFSQVQRLATQGVASASMLARQGVDVQVQALRTLRDVIAELGPEYAALFAQVDVAIQTATNSALDATSAMQRDLRRAGQQIGRQFVQGVVDGTLSMEAILKTALNIIINLMIKTMTKGLEMSSPSKVAVGWGENIGLGLALGLKNSMTDVGRAADGLVASVTPSITIASRRASGMTIPQALSGTPQMVVDSGPDLEEVLATIQPRDPLLAARLPEVQALFAEVIVALKKNGMRF